MMHWIWLVFISPWVFLSACQAGVAPVTLPPEPGPNEPVILWMPHELAPILPAVARCAEDHPTLGLLVNPQGIDAAPSPYPSLTLRWGEPVTQPAFAALLAWETITFVHHPGSPAPTSLQDLLTLAQNTSPLEPKNALWAASPGSSLLALAASNLPPELADPKNTYLILDIPTALGEVATYPGSIAYIPTAWLNDTVRPFTLPGIEFNDFPILITAEKEPAGTVRSLIACLQSGAGQPLLADIYPHRP